MAAVSSTDWREKSGARMAIVIELKRGEEPRKYERHAMVLVSERPPREGNAVSPTGDGRTFYAYDDGKDVVAVLARAKTWADENIVEHVYVKRESP
jgi:hypothetical protein